MTQFILRRLIFFVLTLFVTSVLIFVLTRVLPGDVARVLLGREASEQQVADLRTELGLDRPLLVQYLNWVTSYATTDWGTTFSSPRQPIRPILTDRFAHSGLLASLALLISIPLAITLGVIGALTAGRLPDTLIAIASLSIASLPEFVTGIVLINVLALKWDLFPPSSSVAPDAPFAEVLPTLWLPAIAASLVLIGYIARLTRAGVIEEMQKDYVRTAVLKGLPYPVVITRHVLRNALIPTITVIANSIGWLISGLVVIEFVFSYPGLGRLLIFAIESRDLALIQSVTMLTVTAILIANLLADVLYMLLNPRISLA